MKPVWIGNLGTRPKNPKLGWFRPENRHFVLGLVPKSQPGAEYLKLGPLKMRFPKQNSFPVLVRSELDVFADYI